MHYSQLAFAVVVQLMLTTVIVSCGAIPVPPRQSEVDIISTEDAGHVYTQNAVKVDLNAIVKEGNASDAITINKPQLSSGNKDIQPDAVTSPLEIIALSVPEPLKALDEKKPVVIKATQGAKKYKLARKKYNAGYYADATDILEKLTIKYNGNFAYRDLLVLAYTKYASYLENKAELLEAQTILEKAISIQPHNLDLQRQRTELENRRNAEKRYVEGVEAMKSNDNDKAMDAFSQVLELRPGHELAKKQITFMKSKFVDTYYKKAMTLYRKQELAEAITTWNRVLKLDPDHEMAKLYRARAIELKEKLEKL